MRVADFDYELPKNLIAQRPAATRDGSRLLVLDRKTHRYYHEDFPAILRYLRAGDVLVVNDSKVLPARLLGKRVQTGGRWEGLFLGVAPGGWEFLTKTRGKVAEGERIAVEGAEAELELFGRTPTGSWLVRPCDPTCEPFALLQQAGHVPLPPYIRDGRDEPDDRNRYQTVYADRAGSVAAPTAGLHFTPDLLNRIREQGVGLERVTLHVGVGTFAPVKADRLEDHRMHAEWCELEGAVAERLRAARSAGGRIVAVGTTATRTLESAAIHGTLQAFSGPTELFVTPGYEFRAVDGLLTNFHLPRSTLLMLTTAFGGYEAVMNAYREAVRRKYRFFSYGDAMLILDL